MRPFNAILLLIITPGSAQAESQVGPEGFVHWNEEYIEEVADRLEQEPDDKPIVYETIGNYKGHSMYLVLRGRTGLAELHETEADFQISIRGNATLVIGGELVGREYRPRQQQRGTAIKNGTSVGLAPGDIIHVPIGVPHQFIIEPDEPYLYILIKFNEVPLE